MSENAIIQILFANILVRLLRLCWNILFFQTGRKKQPCPAVTGHRTSAAMRNRRNGDADEVDFVTGSVGSSL